MVEHTTRLAMEGIIREERVAVPIKVVTIIKKMAITIMGTTNHSAAIFIHKII